MDKPSRMTLTGATGSDFWNDSCSVRELTEAVAHGAVGATSNPVIVSSVVRQEPEIWLPVLDQLVRDFPRDTEDEIAWRLIETIGMRAAKVLEPVFREHKGRKGRLSLQVNPKLYRDPERMLEHARRLASVAPNVAIKAPCIAEGLAAIEEMTALGICVNVTVSFTVPQVIAAAETIERGLKRAEKNGIDTSTFTPYVTLMVGRLDDHLKRVMAKERLSIDPGYLEWAGVAAFKKCYALFRERGYRSTLLSAAYRNHMHWSAFLGGNVVMSMPYEWWTRFNASSIEVRPAMQDPVDPAILRGLTDTFVEFRRAYDEQGIAPADFIHFGATVHTLNQFLGGYGELLAYVRERMLR
jgi:transaldolase